MQLVHQFNSSIDGDNVIIESEMWSPLAAEALAAAAGRLLSSIVWQEGKERRCSYFVSQVADLMIEQ